MQSEQGREFEKELKNAWIEVVAACIRDARRKGSLDAVIRSRGRSEALDWIEHNLEFSKTEMDVDAVIQRFANKLSLQAPQLPLETVEFLEEHDEEALEVLRRKTKIIVLFAAEKAGLVKRQPRTRTLDKFVKEVKE